MNPRLDQYFTPPGLAAELAAAITLDEIGLVGDFAAGDGELLRAASSRWPSATCVATDVDLRVVEGLRQDHPHWLVSRCDFTNGRSRGRSDALRGRKGKFDAIILNPPFSCRGGTRRSVTLNEVSLTCSPTIRFIIEATAYLRTGGQLVAIVPYGSLQSIKDSDARDLLSQMYGLKLIRTYARGGFSTCTPRTAIIRLEGGADSSKQPLFENRPVQRIYLNGHCPTRVSVRRGRVQKQTSPFNGPEALPLIHTTEIRASRLLESSHYVAPKYESISGPAVLLPRVGKPSPSKLAVLGSRHSQVVLSECVLAVECIDEAGAQTLFSALQTNWNSLEILYGGTCARYITVAALSDFLDRLGLVVSPYGETIRCGQTSVHTSEQRER